MNKLTAAFALTLAALSLNAATLTGLAVIAWRSPRDGAEWAFLLPASLLVAGGVFVASVLAKEA